MSFQCSNCGSTNADDATFCTNCGNPFSTEQTLMGNLSGMQVQQKKCVNCHKSINVTFTTCPFCGVVQPTGGASTIPGAPVQSGTKNKTTAGLLGIFLGSFGVHKFYLGQTGLGILYLVFCWTGISGVVGIIDGIVFLNMSDQEFLQKYH